MKQGIAALDYWFMRHGETQGNIDKIIQGWMPCQLSDLGAHQAKMVGRRLAQERFTMVYASDLKRTVETAQLVLSQSAHYSDLHNHEGLLVADMRLREKSAGVYEGQPLGSTSQAAKQNGIDPREYKPAGGESWLDLNSRLSSFLEETVEKHHLNQTLTSHYITVTYFLTQFQQYTLHSITMQRRTSNQRIPSYQLRPNASLPNLVPSSGSQFQGSLPPLNNPSQSANRTATNTAHKNYYIQAEVVNFQTKKPMVSIQFNQSPITNSLNNANSAFSPTIKRSSGQQHAMTLGGMRPSNQLSLPALSSQRQFSQASVHNGAATRSNPQNQQLINLHDYQYIEEESYDDIQSCHHLVAMSLQEKKAAVSKLSHLHASQSRPSIQRGTGGIMSSAPVSSLTQRSPQKIATSQQLPPQPQFAVTGSLLPINRFSNLPSVLSPILERENETSKLEKSLKVPSTQSQIKINDSDKSQFATSSLLHALSLNHNSSENSGSQASAKTPTISNMDQPNPGSKEQRTNKDKIEAQFKVQQEQINLVLADINQKWTEIQGQYKKQIQEFERMKTALVQF